MTSQENVECCMICFEEVTSQTVLGCCRQVCHPQRVKQWIDVRLMAMCPHCRQTIPIIVLNRSHVDSWKQDKEFVKEVKEVWKDNPFWFGVQHKGHKTREGFLGELKNPYEADKKIFCFLGYTKNQVIPRMKRYLSLPETTSSSCQDIPTQSSLDQTLTTLVFVKGDATNFVKGNTANHSSPDTTLSSCT